MNATKASKEQIKEAFRKTIERWEMIVEDIEFFGVTSCSLCLLENEPEDVIGECNDSCPIRSYKGENHHVCCDTPYGKFYHNRTREGAEAELNFLREVYLDFLENLLQGQLDGWNKEMKAEYEEVKKEEWINITDKLEAKAEMITESQGYISLYYNETLVAFTRSHHDSEGLELVSYHPDYKLETKGGDFSVFKRIEK